MAILHTQILEDIQRGILKLGQLDFPAEVDGVVVGRFERSAPR